MSASNFLETLVQGRKGQVAPTMPVLYGPPAATFPISPEMGSRPEPSLCAMSSPACLQLALEAVVVILVTAQIMRALMLLRRVVEDF
jgi:hypothetical protein